MNLTHLPAVVGAIVASVRGWWVAGIAPVPALGLVLQISAVGTLMGSLVALHASRRWNRTDTWAITTAWTAMGAVVGLIVAVVALVL